MRHGIQKLDNDFTLLANGGRGHAKEERENDNLKNLILRHSLDYAGGEHVIQKVFKRHATLR